jgi:hypothetical protein
MSKVGNRTLRQTAEGCLSSALYGIQWKVSKLGAGAIGDEAYRMANPAKPRFKRAAVALAALALQTPQANAIATDATAWIGEHPATATWDFLFPVAGATVTSCSPGSSEFEGSFSKLPSGMSPSEYEAQTGSSVTGNDTVGYFQCRNTQSYAPETIAPPIPPQPTAASETLPPATTPPATTPPVTAKPKATAPKPKPKATTTTSPPIQFGEITSDKTAADTSDANPILQGGTLRAETLTDRARNDAPKEEKNPKPKRPKQGSVPVVAIITDRKEGDGNPDASVLPNQQSPASGAKPPLGQKDPTNPGAAMLMGKQFINDTPLPPGTSSTSKEAVVDDANQEIRALIARNAFLVYANLMQGNITIDNIKDTVMPDGMEDYAWCAGFVTEILEQSGIPITGGRFEDGASETGALNLMRLFQFGQKDENDQAQFGFEDPDTVISGKYKPQLGDLLFFERGGPGLGHVGIVVDTSKEGIVTTIEGNLSKTVKLKTRSTADLQDPGDGLTAFMGVGTIEAGKNSTSKMASLKATDTASPSIANASESSRNQTIVVVNAPANTTSKDVTPQPSIMDQAKGLVLDTTPDTALNLLNLVTGIDLETPEEPVDVVSDDNFIQGQQYMVNGRLYDMTADPAAIFAPVSDTAATTPETAAAQTDAASDEDSSPKTTESTVAAAEDLKELPEDPRDMSDAQLAEVDRRLAKMTYEDTHSNEEFILKNRLLLFYISKKTGIPASVVGAHLLEESGSSTDPARQAEGLPSELFEKMGIAGVKASQSKKDGSEPHEAEYAGDTNGCRLPYLEVANMDTMEGTPGKGDRIKIKDGFCTARNFRDAGITYIRLLLDSGVYNFDGTPVDAATAIDKMGPWATNDEWGPRILGSSGDVSEILANAPPIE